jgi:AcrR family transcriptional regulator
MAVDLTARRGADSEQAIMDAARHILAREGPDGLSMRSVADRVGMSATAIYRYFENKDALVARVVQSGFDRFGEYLRDAAARHPSGSLDRLAALGEAYIRFALENQEYFKLLFSLQHPHPHSIEELPDSGGHGLLRSAVEEAMASGAMRRANPDLVAVYLWSIAHGLLTLSMTCRLEDCPEFRHGALTKGPVELFRSFREFVRHGLQASLPATEEGSEGGDA